jgi:hypothetical protein
MRDRRCHHRRMDRERFLLLGAAPDATHGLSARLIEDNPTIVRNNAADPC